MFKVDTKRIFVYLAVIGLLIFLHFIRVLRPMENVFISILNPLTSGIYSVSSDLRSAYNKQTDKRDLIGLVKVLEEEVRQLTVEQARLITVKEENEKLRQFLKFFLDREQKHILANVISGGGFISKVENEKILIIDKGEEDGLEVGLVVINSQGIIVGKIVEVSKHTAKVSLTTNSDCKLAATVQNNDKTSGVTEGELGLTIKMGLVPQTENLEVVDIVVTSGLERNISRGLVIGTIKSIDQSSNEVWQSATIEPLANLDDLIIVAVLLPG